MHKQGTQNTTVLPYEKQLVLQDKISKDTPCGMPTLLAN